MLDLINLRLDEIQLRRSHAYYRDSNKYLKLFYKHIGNPMVSTIDSEQVNGFLTKVAKDLRKRGKTNSKLNAIIRALKALFNHAINLCDIEMKNPLSKIKLYGVDVKIRHIPSEDEIKAVKAISTPAQRLLIDFVRQSACRINEALRFAPQDIRDKYIVLYTRKARGGGLTPRRVPRPECLSGLKFDGKRVFDEWDVYPRFLARHIKQLKQPAWNWHNLRHKKASEWSDEGKPLFEIMNLLGHSNLKTTQIYLHLVSLAKL